MGTLLCLCLLFLAAAFLAPSVQAQVYSGSLTGVITDPSGAVVPGAKVKLTDVDKGFTYEAETDESGRYVLRSLPPSNYRLSVTLSGFKTHVQEGIILSVSQNATVDAVLQVGVETQTVEVLAAAPILSTQDAVTGQELNRTYINDLPLVGRAIFDLAYLSPGVTEPAGGPNAASDNNFVSNGGRNATADILLDGVSTTNIEQNSGIQVPLYTPSVDAVQEFKVQQSNFSSEIGFSGATIINVVTRSGTNEFHGSLYEFLRNDILTANNWFNNANGVEKAPRRYNLFGGTIGGPIRKDRTFFFFDYEGVRDRNAQTFLGGVPSAAMRQGNFGEICHDGFDASGLCNDPEGQIWDPYSGVQDPELGFIRSSFIPFNNIATYQSPGNPKLDGTGYQLPARPGNLIDPVASKMMQFYPLPNISGTDRFNNWIHSGTDRSDKDQFDIKVDHGFGVNDRLSAKYAYTKSSGQSVKCYNNPGDPCDGGPGETPAHLFSVNWVHTFSPKTLLSFTYGVTRQRINSQNSLANYPDYDIVRDLGLPSYMLRSGVPQLPSIELDNYRPVGNQTWSYYQNGNETHHLLASLSRVTGRHELKFGYDGRMHRQNSLFAGVPGGVFNFSPGGTAETGSGGGGDDFASFLTGVGIGGWGGEYQVPVTPAAQSFQHAGFVQDNWRATDKLTLNLGLRYDLDLARTERYNRMSHFDPEVASPLQVPGLNLRGGLKFADANNRTVYGSDKNNLGPRFGLAYRLTDKTVMRGGYGLFYSPSRRGAAGPDAFGWWGFDALTEWSDFTSFEGDGVTPWGRLSDPFPPSGPALPPGSSQGLLTSVGARFRAPVKSITATPYEQTWSFGFQRELPGQIVIDTNYVGKKGTKLYFASSGQINRLGPEIESFSHDQIVALNEFVPNPFQGIIEHGSLSGPEIQAYQLSLPFPHFTDLDSDERPVANSIYHALQLRAEKRFSQGLQFLGTYTWSKSIDDASVHSADTEWLGGAVSLQNPNKRFLERSLSQFDIPHVFQFSWVYDLPVGRGKALGSDWNPVMSAIIGGWKFSGSWRLSSGQPIGLSLAGGEAQGLPTYGELRPNVTGPLERNTGPDFVHSYFANPEVIEIPDDFTLGNAPRTLSSIRSPGTNLANLGLFKEIPLGRLREGARLEYRAEFFNAFNRPHFGVPDSTFEGGNFGTITSLSRPAREIQMALKFYW
jgi:Carboxypeptidase regulatory-like domain/TonB dependent receptor